MAEVTPPSGASSASWSAKCQNRKLLRHHRFFAQVHPELLQRKSGSRRGTIRWQFAQSTATSSNFVNASSSSSPRRSEAGSDGDTRYTHVQRRHIVPQSRIGRPCICSDNAVSPHGLTRGSVQRSRLHAFSACPRQIPVVVPRAVLTSGRSACPSASVMSPYREVVHVAR